MKEVIVKALVNLIKIKSLVTLALTAAFVILSLRGDVGVEQFMTIFTVVIGFYFGTQAIKENVPDPTETVEPSEDGDEYNEN